MSSKDLTTTINSLADFSIGASSLDYTMQCTPSLLVNNWLAPHRQSTRYYYAGPKLIFGWQHDVSGGEIAHVMAVRTPETSVEGEDSKTLQLRIACHYLVGRAEDEGLPELFESLKDTLEFYTAQHVERLQLASSGVPIKLGQKYDR